MAMRHGANFNPANRFGTQHAESDREHFEFADDAAEVFDRHPIEYIPDDSRSIVTENSSPDIPFRYSVNPYRGCIHGCAYCYARPYHEYLGLSAGLDFETKIFVKHRAPELLRQFLSRDAWVPEEIVFSGITDCYQPAEREFRLTRGCLEVAREARQPVGIVTKNALVARDLDILGEMAAGQLVHVAVSVTTLDAELARFMEPRTSTPAARLRTISELSAAGVPVRAIVAPVIPGLNDAEIPAILKEAKAAGALSAAYILLRLPLNVEPIFLEWLERTQPLKKERVLSRIRSTRGGDLSDSKFGSRMRGEGEIAKQIQQTFKVFAAKHGLDRKLPPLDASKFLRPLPRSGQMRLFD